jgi:bla regulator protein blaR1
MMTAIGRHLFESTLFAIVVALLCARKWNRVAATRHALWLLATAKFAIPASLLLTVGVSIHSLIPAPSLPLAGSITVSGLLASRGLPPQAIESLRQLSFFFLALWLAGAIFKLARWLGRLFASTQSPGVILDDEKEALTRLQSRIGMRRVIALRASKLRVMPSLSGIWRPALTLPEGLSLRLTSREFDAVLLHELAHAKRWDNLSGAFVHALVCIFWFYPVVWWIERRIIAERELACDEMAVQWGATPQEYVAGILSTCRFQLAEAAGGISTITSSNLKKRMEVIMSYTANKRVSQAPKFAAAVLACLMIFIPLGAGFLGTTALHGQPVPGSHSAFATPVTCVADGENYPEGTVVQRKGERLQQMCANFAGRPVWVRTSKEIRERSSNVVVLPPFQPFICQPAPSSSAKYCACREHGIFSWGAIVNSANGKLRCWKGEWYPATPADLGQKQ